MWHKWNLGSKCNKHLKEQGQKMRKNWNLSDQIELLPSLCGNVCFFIYVNLFFWEVKTLFCKVGCKFNIGIFNNTLGKMENTYQNIHKDKTE